MCRTMAGLQEFTGALVLATGLVASTSAFANDDDFYKGKTITLTISAGPGGGYAAYALTMAKHLRKHIPGNPEIIRQHRQGAGGLVAAQYIHGIAPKDGTAIASIHREAVTGAALFEEKGANFDPREFSWIGSINKDTSLCVSWHTNAVKTIADTQKTPLIVGGLGPGADTDIFPLVFNNVLGTKFKLVTGYKEGTAITLALERGEVQGRCGWSWSSIKTSAATMLAEKKLNLLFIGGLAGHPEIPASVPLVTSLVKSPEQRDILEVVFGAQGMSRPILAPPGVPAARLKLLREAFDKTMKDPEFLAEAAQQKLDIEPVTGQEVEKLVALMMSKPKAIIAAAKDAMSRTGGLDVTQTKSEAGAGKTK